MLLCISQLVTVGTYNVGEGLRVGVLPEVSGLVKGDLTLMSRDARLRDAE